MPVYLVLGGVMFILVLLLAGNLAFYQMYGLDGIQRAFDDMMRFRFHIGFDSVYEDDEIVFLIDQTFRRQGIIMPQAYIKEAKADSTYKIKNETLNDVFGLQSDEYFHVPKKKMPKEEYVKQMDDKKTAMTKAVTSLFYKGLTVAQIAEELHISKRTVISRKNDAKKFGWIPFRGKFFEKSLCWTA